MSELAALSTVLVVIRFLFVLETALAADRGRGRSATRICITRSTRVGDRGERMSSGCGSTGCGVGISDTSGGIAGSASAAHASAARAARAAHASAHASAAHTHTHASATAGVDDNMGHARMTSNNLSVHSDGGHPTSDVGYLLALGFDAGRSRKLVPVSEL